MNSTFIKNPNNFVITLLIFFSLSLFSNQLCAQFDGNQTPTYPKLVSFYDSLSKLKQVELYNLGNSDYGLPIYVCILNGENDSLKTFDKLKEKGSVFINNGIHPGEPDGINACGKLTLDYLSKKIKIDKNVIVSFILCYNVGGMMNRNSHSRANQNGPEEYGFRGNSQNLDLNRDFIKVDAENTFTFLKIFHAVNPYVFIDTHVSNGADYQYVLTLIHSLKDRMLPSLKKLTYGKFIPDLEKKMKTHGIFLAPYVESIDKIPDNGIEAFNDLPRYSSGFASLFPCISITSETHMLKPFETRVEATYLYLKEVINWSGVNFQEIEKTKVQANKELQNTEFFKFNYKRSEKHDSIVFKGFEHGYKKSKVTDLDRLYYDRNKPFEKKIAYYNNYIAQDSVKIPNYYLVESQCQKIIERLKANSIKMHEIKQDTVLNASSITVSNFQSAKIPYEGHFPHNSVEINEVKKVIKLKKGGYLIPTKQISKLLICSVLEPNAEDSYFKWNFFDSYLQEKEYFSDYVFEELAEEVLRENPDLKVELDLKRKEDPDFAANSWSQLYFIYARSKYFEPSFMKLPIYKIY